MIYAEQTDVYPITLTWTPPVGIMHGAIVVYLNGHRTINS